MKKGEECIQKIAVMGGTFDPIHFGHLAAAEAVRTELNLEKVLFLPAGRPAHKQNQIITEPKSRFIMTALAVANNPNFEASSLEIERPGTTYTIETIKQLITIYGSEAEIYFIIGADSVFELPSWYKVRELLRICKIVVVTRPGFDNEVLEQKINELTEEYNGDIYLIEIPSLEISSTDIRDRIKTGKSIKYLLPESVESYIKENDIYRE